MISFECQYGVCSPFKKTKIPRRFKEGCSPVLRKDLEQQEEYKRRIKVMTEEKKARRADGPWISQGSSGKGGKSNNEPSH